MRHCGLAGFASLCALHCAFAEERIEYRYLAGLANPKHWSPAECETAVSAFRPWEQPAVKMHIPVDFSAGEKQYPIGWPRMYLNLADDETGWQDYDRFEFQLFTESSRQTLPKRPVVFHLYDAQGQKKLVPLEGARIGAWTTVSLNLSDLGLTGPATRLGININEADYADKDTLDFHLGGFRLVRALEATVTELKAAAPAVFCDSRVLPVELVVEGPPDKLGAGVPFQLRSGSRVVFSQTVPVKRGRQTLYLPLAGAPLDPGAYALVAHAEAPGLRREAAVQITSSPWR